MNINKKEEKVFGRAQFEQFLIDNDYESFTAKQVAYVHKTLTSGSDTGKGRNFQINVREPGHVAIQGNPSKHFQGHSRNVRI